MRACYYRFSLLMGLVICFFTAPPLGRGSAAAAAGLPQRFERDSAPCSRLEFADNGFIVCRADPKHEQIRLFLTDERGRALNYFRNVRAMLARFGQKPLFLMNAGMYHKDYAPVGLYISGGRELYPINRSSGKGNFFMKPNGVFYIAGGKAGALDTESFIRARLKPQLATQSGPMLVINNRVNPHFIKNSSFKEYRNGVGVSARGEVFFAISDGKVNFYDFAHFFRDGLNCPNALFLDGSISSLYAPQLQRADWFFALGPIIGVTVSAD